MIGKLYIVGVGPGHHDHMTFRAKEVIGESDTIVGYETYVNLVQDLIEGKTIHRYAMTQEVERAHQCIDLAKSGKIDFIYDKTILYRQHNNNVAGAKNYGLMYLLTKFKDFLTIMKYFRFLSKYFSKLSFFELLYIKIKINFVRLFNLTTY